RARRAGRAGGGGPGGEVPRAALIGHPSRIAPWRRPAPVLVLGSMKALWRGQVIAESERTREVRGYRYFPRESGRRELLVPSPKTASDPECPHGVQFYDVVSGIAGSERAAWSYEQPGAPLREVDHWIGFWEDVQIS